MAQGSKVTLHLYDISFGMAKSFSLAFLGKQLEGIWHTGVVVYGKEYFWGGDLQTAPPGQTYFGVPTKVIELGYTEIPEPLVFDFIQSVGPRYTLDTYRLLSNNCNNFSNELASFLLGKGIPTDIVNLPDEVLNTPMGQMLRPMLEGIEAQRKDQIRTGQAIGPTNFGGFTGFPSVYGPPPTTTRPAPAFPPAAAAATPAPAVSPFANLSSMLNAAIPAPPPALGTPASAASRAAPVDLSKLKWIRPSNTVMLSTQGAVSAIVGKLRQQLGGESLPHSAEAAAAVLDELAKYMDDSSRQQDQPPAGALELLDHIFRQWDSSKWFAPLFLLRLLVLRPQVTHYYTTAGKATLAHIMTKSLTSTQPKSTRAMALVLASNMFVTAEGAATMLSQDICEPVLDAAAEALHSPEPTIRQPAAGLVYNYTLFLGKTGSDGVIQCLTATVDVLTHHANIEDETLFRILLALGQLVHNDRDAATLLSDLEFAHVSSQLQKSKSGKIAELAQEVDLVLRANST